MPALDVAKFMRDHALNLICGCGRMDQASMQINSLTAGNEGIDRFVVDQDDIDIGRFKPGCADQRFGNFIEKSLGFGIAEDRLGMGWLECN